MSSPSTMTRAFAYRLVPSRAQALVLLEWLRLTRELYNAALQERRDAWKKQHISITRYDQQGQLASVREIRPEFANVPVVVLRGAIRKLDKAFVGFFRRCKSGDKPGHPRFKGANRWNTLEFDNPVESFPVVAGDKRVKVPLLGKVKLRYHRPLEGRPRTMKITLNGDGHWYISISCDRVAIKPLSATNKTVGIDLGLSSYVATSDGELFSNPRPLAAARLCTERADRRVTRRKCRSKRRQRAVRLLAKHHAHIANVRRENIITVARSPVSRYDTIFVEDLDVRRLMHSWLAKSINDAAWGKLKYWLDVKAEEAGRTIIRVDPRGTSQICSQCGTRGEHKTLAVRIHKCSDCGLEIDRDVNAAINIRALGMRVQGEAARLRAPQRSAKRGLSMRNPPDGKDGIALNNLCAI